MTAAPHAVQDPVIRMGNDIARQFAHRPHDRAVEEVSAHLLKFWEPRMRADLLRRVAADEEGVDPVVAAAVRTWPHEEATQADRDEPSGG